MRMAVGHNITLAALARFLRFDVVRRRAEAAAVRRSIEQLRIKAQVAGGARRHALGRQPAEGRVWPSAS